MSMELHSIYPMFLCALFLLLSNSDAIDIISKNQAIKDGDTIVSDGETFELGFFIPGKSKNRYMGIWYKKISVFTIVWAANREASITDTSGMIKLSRDGNLMILDGGNNIIWYSNSTGSVRNLDPVAELLDNGNLVVWDKSGH